MSGRWRYGFTLVGMLAVLALSCTAQPRPVPGGSSGGTPGAGSGGPVVGSCPMFPADSIWHADVRGLAVHPSSVAWRNSIGASTGLHADFGSGTWEGTPIGIPFTTVGAGQARVPMVFDYWDESDPGPYPIPSDAPVEGGSDHHVIVVDTSDCRLYETWDSRRQPDGSWQAGSGATWDLRSNALRPAGWTSADAAGLPILPGLVRYEEVAAGDIDHMIRFTAPRTQRAYVWPARHFASSSTDPARPPMGAVFRLRADVDISGMSPQAKVVAQALKDHGMILADNGSSWFLSGTPDERWDNDALRDLAGLRGADFDAVDTSVLQVAADSGQRR